MLNNLTIGGRITKDLELRYTQNQKAVLSFDIAVEGDYKGQDNQRPVYFFPCVAWGGTGETISKYFGKGDQIILVGRLENRQWTDKNNNKRTTTEILVEKFYFGVKKQKSDSNDSGESYSQPAFEEMDEDGELPF